MTAISRANLAFSYISNTETAITVITTAKKNDKNKFQTKMESKNAQRWFPMLVGVASGTNYFSCEREPKIRPSRRPCDHLTNKKSLKLSYRSPQLPFRNEIFDFEMKSRILRRYQVANTMENETLREREKPFKNGG